MTDQVNVAPKTMLEFDQMVQKISKAHVSAITMTIQSLAATLEAIERDLKERAQFLQTTQENIKNMMERREEMTEHIAVLRASRKVIFSGREARERRKLEEAKAPENGVDGFLHFSRQKYTSLQEHLSGDTDEIGLFLEANAKVD